MFSVYALFLLTWLILGWVCYTLWEIKKLIKPAIVQSTAIDCEHAPDLALQLGKPLQDIPGPTPSDQPSERTEFDLNTSGFGSRNRFNL